VDLKTHLIEPRMSAFGIHNNIISFRRSTIGGTKASPVSSLQMRPTVSPKVDLKTHLIEPRMPAFGTRLRVVQGSCWRQFFYVAPKSCFRGCFDSSFADAIIFTYPQSSQPIH
jgi:hypothetical protein